MATECGQCLTLYDEDNNVPRICNSCGHSLCQKCLSKICSLEHVYKCPYCKNSTKAIWTKNQSLLNLINQTSSNNKCEPHNRKTIYFCCSANCIVSPGICDLGQCSRLHKQKGTNNLPLSFFFETPREEVDGISNIIVQNLLTQTFEVVDKILKQEKKKFLNKCLESSSVSGFKQDSQNVINQIRDGKFHGVSSKNLYEVKKQMIELQEERETQMMSRYIQLVEDEKVALIDRISIAINSIEVNLFETIVMGKKPANVSVQKQTPEFMTLKPSSKIQVKQVPINTKTETKITRKTSKQLYEDAINLCFEPKAHLQYELIRQVIGRDFSISLLFSSSKDEVSMFKQKIAGQPNLFIRVQLGDGKIIGSYFKQSYPVSFGQDLFLTDSDAFVYWLNEFRVYRAAKGSIAQYDISPDYLFSCGSTYNWDGFWFRKDFTNINPELPSNTKQIKSKQYVDLSIPIPDRTVVRFECYQLQFKSS